MAIKFFLVLALAAVAHAQYHQQQPTYQHASAGYSHGHEEYNDHPKYEFAYDIKDEKTGDYHARQEARDGDVTKGFYTLIDADGYKRTVEYSVEGKSGFNAVVHREPTGHAPAPAAPKYQAHQAPQYQAYQAPQYSGHKY